MKAILVLSLVLSCCGGVNTWTPTDGGADAETDGGIVPTYCTRMVDAVCARELDCYGTTCDEQGPLLSYAFRVERCEADLGGACELNKVAPCVEDIEGQACEQDLDDSFCVHHCLWGA